MLASITTKSIRDATLWTASAIAVLLVLIVVALPAYSSFGDEYISLFESMPDWIAVVYGEDANSVAGLVGTALFALMGPLVLLVYAIGFGASAAVGEEEARTLPLLLANPLSRTRVLVTKAAVAGAGVVLIVLALWAGTEVTAGLVGIDLASQDIFAMSVHLAAFTALFGALALAGAAWSGSSTIGIGVAALTAVISYIASTWLPVIEGLSDVAQYSPWQLYVGADALHDGIDVVLLAITLILTAALFGASVVGLRRRDLKG
jgi:ABC-2 type transport system permease protein